MTTKYDYIIFHKNCFDGFTGFYLFLKTKYWEKKPMIYPDFPSATTIPPEIKDKNVIIIDVAYKPQLLNDITKLAKKVLFIDHHITIRDEVKNLNINNLTIVYNEKYSGASLVWKYFFGSKKNMPQFVKYIEDNDIGAWKYKQTLNFIVGLEVNFNTNPTFENLKNWDKLLNDDYLKALTERGKLYNEYKNYLINKSSKKYRLMKFPSKKIIKKYPELSKFKEGKFIVAVVTNFCPSASLVGKKIVETVDCDFCFLWYYLIDKNKFIVSLRSNKIDVGEIAKILSGGGHKYASAFSFYKDEIDINDFFIKEAK